VRISGEHLIKRLPEVRGRLSADVNLCDLTWFRVGGPAQVVFSPADEDDLAGFLQELSADIPVTTIGIGSNLLVRDGGIPGVVIRLGRGFGAIEVEEDYRISAGAAVPDVKLAISAAEAGIAGLAFYRGIPGSIGGALRMNGGSYGTETKDVLVRVHGVAPKGEKITLKVEEMGYSYRHCSVAEDIIFTRALFQGTSGDPVQIAEDMRAITEAREQTQPIKSRTGGSTFKNPEGHKSWQLIDAAGCRGLKVGGAHVSEKHCNFLINEGEATAKDLETLGETVRARVLAHSGVQLEWEIKRIGVE
jgi:UDP-N-acetylmuramate dehydrogenase